MPSPHSGGSQYLITLVVLGLVVVRFLMRELRPRRIPDGRMYLVALYVSALAVGLWIWMYTLHADLVVLVAGSVAAVLVGCSLGWAVAHYTLVSRDGASTILRGSFVTVAIWVGALLLRLAGRFAVGPQNVSALLALNAVFVVMLAAAMLFSRRRFAMRSDALRSGALAGVARGA